MQKQKNLFNQVQQPNRLITSNQLFSESIHAFGNNYLVQHLIIIV